FVRCVSDSPRFCRAQRLPRAAPARCALPRCEDVPIEAAEAGSRWTRRELPAQQAPKLLAAAGRNSVCQTLSKKTTCVALIISRLARDRVDQVERSGVLSPRFVVGLDGFVVCPCGIEKLDEVCLASAVRVFGDLPHVSGSVEHRAFDPLDGVARNVIL